MAAIQNVVVHFVTQLMLENVSDHSEGAASVVALQVLDVFQQERFGLPLLQDLLDLMEKRSLGRVVKSVGPPQRVFL